MSCLKFTVWGQPQPKGSARAIVPKGWKRPIVTSDNKSLKAWESVVRSELQRVMASTDRHTLAALYDAPLSVTLMFHLPRPASLAKREVYPVKKPDLDKLARGTVDALSGVVMRDDARIVEIIARKMYAATATKVEITVSVFDAMVVDIGPELFADVS